MIEILSAISAGLAIIGVVANNRRLRWCFLVWIISNATAAFIHIASGLWSLAARDIVFLILAIEGYYRWGKMITYTDKEITTVIDASSEAAWRQGHHKGRGEIIKQMIKKQGRKKDNG